MYDILTLVLAVIVIFGPAVSMVSYGLRGYHQAQQRQAHPMPFVMFYSLFGMIIGGVITTIIFILAEGTVGSKNISLKQHVCKYITGGDPNNSYCSKYQL